MTRTKSGTKYPKSVHKPKVGSSKWRFSEVKMNLQKSEPFKYVPYRRPAKPVQSVRLQALISIKTGRTIGYANPETGELFTTSHRRVDPIVVRFSGLGFRRNLKYAELRSIANAFGIECSEEVLAAERQAYSQVD